MLACLNGYQEAKQQWTSINIKQIVLTAVLVFGSQAVLAASGASGGFSEAKSIVDDIVTGIAAIVGSICVLLLIWNVLQGAMKKKDWLDVGTTCLWIVAVGAAGGFALYLYNKGQKMKFS